MNPDQQPQNPLPPADPTPTPAPTPAPAPPADNNPAQPASKVANPLSAMQPGEQVICEITRHPIGLIANYIVSGFLLIFFAVAAVLAPRFASDELRHNVSIWAGGSFVIVAAFIMLALYIMTKVYKGNCWIVTSDSLTQVTQVSLFSRQSSQLSLHNLEDVTVQQNGIIQSMFNYGTLRAETAGERSKFVFRYCPDPNARARDILMTRETFMAAGGFPSKNDGPGVNFNTEVDH